MPYLVMCARWDSMIPSGRDAGALEGDALSLLANDLVPTNRNSVYPRIGEFRGMREQVSSSGLAGGTRSGKFGGKATGPKTRARSNGERSERLQGS